MFSLTILSNRCTAVSIHVALLDDRRVMWDFYAVVHQNQQYLTCRTIAKYMDEFLAYAN